MVTIVVGLIAVVREIEHHGVLVFPYVEDVLHHCVVIIGGIVILRNVGALILVKVFFLALNRVGVEHVKSLLLWVSAHWVHVLPH